MKKLFLVSLLFIACTKVEEPFVVYDSGVVKYVDSLTVIYEQFRFENSNYSNTVETYNFIYDDEYNITGFDYTYYLETNSTKQSRNYKVTYVYEEDIIYMYVYNELNEIYDSGIYYLDSGYLTKYEYYWRDDDLRRTCEYRYDANGYVQAVIDSDYSKTYPAHKYNWQNNNIITTYYPSYTHYKDNLNIVIFPIVPTDILFNNSYFGLKFPGLYSTTFPEYIQKVQGQYTYDEDCYPTMIYFDTSNVLADKFTILELTYIQPE